MDDDVASVMGEPAWLSLDGAHNVRDVGGLPASGGLTRPGILLRGDAVDALTEADVRLLVDHVGIARVIDLRTAAERAERGEGRLAVAGVEVVALEAFSADDLARRRQARSALLAAGARPTEIMIGGYLEIATLGGRAFAAALDLMVQPGGTPALVHCTAGKDRTGVLVALLLDAARVDREAIIADYAATSDRMGPIIERIRGAEAFQHLAHDLPAFVFEARPETMAGFLDQLDQHFGGAAELLLASGASQEAVVAWRELIVA